MIHPGCTWGRKSWRAVLVMLVSLLVVAGCGQSSSPVERQEKKEGVEQAAKEKPTPSPAPSAAAKTCSDFYGPQDAQVYFDKEATPEEKRTLDTYGDGWACNEGDVAWKPEGETTTISTSEADAAKAAAAEQEFTLEQLLALDTNKDYDRQIVMGLGACQVAKYKAENGERAWLEWREKFIDEVAESPPDEVDSIQEEMIKMGYSCTISEAMAGTPQR
jgi:hypothetical protein